MADFFNGPQSNRGQLIRVMGLWEEKDMNGVMMLTGTLSGRVKVNIVCNNFKKGEREPDYYLTLVQIERQDNPGEESQVPKEEPQQKNGIRITGLWRNRDRKGKDYLSGSIQSLRVLIFSNNYHQSSSDPDYIVYVCQSDRQGQGGQGGQGGFGGSQGGFGGSQGGFGGSQGGFGGSSRGEAQSGGFDTNPGGSNTYDDPPF
ncbi:hypothetical protein IKZ40_02230 [bacterium]|nr:hypothetical protein [bacterium]